MYSSTALQGALYISTALQRSTLYILYTLPPYLSPGPAPRKMATCKLQGPFGPTTQATLSLSPKQAPPTYLSGSMCSSMCRRRNTAGRAVTVTHRSDRATGRNRTTRCMYVCRKVKNSQARTGHQRGMGGRWTDDDGTHERHTDTNKQAHKQDTHTLSWRTHNSGPRSPCRPPSTHGAKDTNKGTTTQQTTGSNMRH